MRARLLSLLLLATLPAACNNLASPGAPTPATRGPGVATAVRGAAGLTPGRLAPDFTAADLDGQPVRLQAWRGHPVWINFWATWCPPCKTEMPVLEQKYHQDQDRGLEILGIDLQESPAAVRAWVQGKFHWRFVIDTDGKLADLFDLEGVPTHIFIDRAGVVRSVAIGDLTPAQMDARLAEILRP